MRYVGTRGAWRDDPQPFRAILLEGRPSFSTSLDP